MLMLKNLFLFAGAILVALLPVTPVWAQEAPDVLVKRITKEVMDIARTDEDVQAGKRERIREVVETKILPHLDFRRATAMAVGRHWRAATPQQRQQLAEEFKTLMMHMYAGAMSQIGDQKLEFLPLRMSPGDTEAVVRFHVLQPRRGEPIEVSYRLYKTPDGWKVYDVNVLGVWLIETYKSSFSQEINKDGIDGLIHTLAEKNRRLAGETTAASGN